MKKIFTIILVLFAFASNSQSTTIVISQVYGAGGNTGAIYNADFVELHNVSGSPVSLSGYSIQYASAASTTTWTGVFALPAVSIPAGGYYLIQMSGTGGVGIALPAPDATAAPAIAMAAGAGKVALINGITAVSGCITTAIDLVGYGTTANCSEGSANAPAPSATLADFRNNNGCTDTDNNAADFTTAAPAPRNSSTPINICGAVSPTLTATTLTSFGNVCVNTTSGPNSFTITGSNLTIADVTVGPLAGYTYSTTAGGTYTASLVLTQPGGAYSQQVFVNFTPIAIQSYNGNINISGGGATAIDVAATGAGVNSMPTVTTGAATAITSISATLAGNISANGCSPVSAYGVEYSTTNGFPDGTGTAVASTNISGGNYTSDVAGLTPGITYYYKAYTTNAAGTAYGTQLSFTTISLSPVITVTPLSAFGNVCINTTGGPNSFTINGTNLTAANIVVGPLAGYTFSTTATGTYSNTLTLTQPGGATYTQQVFVNFSPTAVQSYNGNIPVTGAGAPPSSVAASGAGVNTTASVTTGAATAITTNSATLGGSIPSTGCSAVSIYGIEYSTTNGFPNGTGTQVASTNISGGNFTSAISGLAPSTTYYYKAYATNAGGTVYGTQMSFTTSAPVLTATPLSDFGSLCVNTTSDANSFTISSPGLTNANVTVGPLNGYAFSTTATGTYTSTLTITQPGGPFSQTVFVQFTPTAIQTYSGNIPVSGGGAGVINVAASGNGNNAGASVTTGNASVLSPHAATAFGTITGTGCSPIISYGIEYSGISGFTNGHGTRVDGTDLSGSDFSVNLNNLVQGTTYYYKAYARNNGGIAYGDEASFTTDIHPDGLIVYGPVVSGGTVHYSMKDVKPGHYQVRIYNSIGQIVYRTDIILQVNFIDNSFVLPGYIGKGVYTFQLHNKDVKINKRIMVQ